MTDLIGQSLDRYQIVSLLGEGGMGAVYQGHDPTLQRDIAIKVMHAHLARQPDFQQRFLQEAQTAARLSHPGIVQVFDFGQALSLLYIVMAYIPGDNLRQLLKEMLANDRCLLLSEAVQLIRHICLAVDYLHRQGILHRDLKPDNIMLIAEPGNGLPYRPILTDLGLAKLVAGGLETKAGESMGTPAYMSPEQALGQPTDARSDVYSLGILLYELAVGQLPFPIKTITQAIRYHTKEPPPSPCTLRPDLPDEMEQIILKALAKDPGDRFPGATALAETLANLGPILLDETMASSRRRTASASLMTQYQASLVKLRGPSILAEFPKTPVPPGQDRLVILTPEKTAKSFKFITERLTIGRGSDNDVVFDDSQVSRHHARVEFDGVQYKVIDLDSSNGTFLNETKLKPGVPEVWHLGYVLQIGPNWLRLERGQPSAQQPEAPPRATLFEVNAIPQGTSGEGVAIFPQVTQLTVAPGSSTTASISVMNQGHTGAHFQVAVEGIPAEWVSTPISVIQLQPGIEREIKLTIRPPHSPHSRAGDYPLTFQVANSVAPGQVAHMSGQLTVTSYHQFDSDLKPQRVLAGQPAQVIIENQGNAPQTFDLKWQDWADELTFESPRTRLTVPEGELARVTFRIKPRHRRWFGGKQTHVFSTQINSPQGETRKHEGEVISSGLVSPLTLILLLFICLVSAATVGANEGLRYWNTTSATQTAVADQTVKAATQVVLNNLATAQATTATAEASAMAATQAATTATTQAAATATAMSWEADDDRDGLSNRKEEDLGTLPTKADTDQDGLKDGEEQKLGTNPLKADSDGDGWKDDYELKISHTDPLDSDTDGDGIEDPKDENPLQPPIPTKTATATPVPLPPTPIPTATPTKKPVSSGGQSNTSAAPLGVFNDFEAPTNWRQGDEPNGTFDSQSTTLAHSGSHSGKLDYKFQSGGNDYVVFLWGRALGGQPNQITAWVYGDGSGHFLNAWIKDSAGETWQFSFGQVRHAGQWQQLTAIVAPEQPWPAGHIDGPSDGAVTYPISFSALVLDDGSDDYTGSGTIYVDDLASAQGSSASAPPLPPPVIINFRADRTTLNRGECTSLHWDVENVRAVYYQSQGVTGHDSRKECPQATTSYTLRVILKDGSSTERVVTIMVP